MILFIFFLNLGESISLFIKIQNDCANMIAYCLKFNVELRSPKFNNILLSDGPFDFLSPFSSLHRILYHEINDLGTFTCLFNLPYWALPLMQTDQVKPGQNFPDQVLTNLLRFKTNNIVMSFRINIIHVMHWESGVHLESRYYVEFVHLIKLIIQVFFQLEIGQ